MVPPRPQYHIDLTSLPPVVPQQHNRSNSSTATSSPVEPGSGARLPSADSSTAASHSSGLRGNAGSPSHDYGGNGSRFYPTRRTRELATEGGSSRSMWGPPVASGLSTPLRETIPESPGDDGDDTFPDFGPSASDTALPLRSASLRRSRAGTMPSNKTAAVPSVQPSTSSMSSSSRPTPSTSPFRPTPSALGGLGRSNSSSSTYGQSALSRIRAGSMPHRASLIGSSPASSSPFGSGIFSSNYKPPRERASTHSGVPLEPTSPSQQGFWETNFADTDIKTLDYLGLADRPQPGRSTRTDSLDTYRSAAQSTAFNPLFANLGALNRNSNRFRSYSVNAKEKYAADEDNDMDAGGYYSGSITPSSEHIPQSLRNQILQHNLEVQAFVNRASSSRPRARTAGVLDSPSNQNWQSYSPLNARYNSALSLEMAQAASQGDYAAVADALQAMNIRASEDQARLAPDLLDEDATKSLWLGGIPKSVAESSLRALFEKYGTVTSTKVLPEKNCAFVNFETELSAMVAKRDLQGKEVLPGAGPLRIGYAKSRSSSSEATTLQPPGTSGSPDPFVSSSSNNLSQQTIRKGAGFAGADLENLSPPVLVDIQQDVLEIVEELGCNESDRKRVFDFVNEAIAHDGYTNDIPAVQEPSHSRVHDAPRLRDIRKRIDSNACTPAEIEGIAMAMLPEIAELSSDYLGNTVVQKLFENCTEDVKEAMLEHIAPHLAEIGVHKNGTWAAQKIIDLARTPKQKSLIVENLRPFGVALFLDQYGNYVMQGCLKFGLPWNSFIFEVMASRLWDLAQGRFGARAMRACLESHYASKDQQRMVAAVIAIHSVQLATNANGALLLTWFLDTCNFPNRRAVLAPRLIPHLIRLCTHKVAYLTVLKVINQKNEPQARDDILNALFLSPNDSILTEVLRDHTCGATFIFKVITTPFLEDPIRPTVLENIRNVLMNINAQPAQGYKRLMDEVGLSTRNVAAPREPSQPRREANGFQASPAKYLTPQAQSSNFERATGFIQPPQYNAGYQTLPAPGLANEAAILNGGAAVGVPPQLYSPGLAMNTQPPPLAQTSGLPYQQGPYGGPRAPNTFNFPASPMNGYGSPAGLPPMDPYRNAAPGRNDLAPQRGMQMNSSPLMPHTAFPHSNGFGTPMGMQNGQPGVWSQYGSPYMTPQQQQQQSMSTQGGMGSSPRGRR